MVPRFVLGAATGLLIALLVSLSPVLVVVAVAAVLIATVISIAQDAEMPRTMALAGTLVGAGTLFLYGSVNTFAACVGTDDFCGNANVWPLTLLALATIGCGAATAAIVASRVRG